MSTAPQKALIRLPKVMAMTGLSRTTLYRRVKAKQFPAPVDIGETGQRNSPVAWPLAEVEAWIDSRSSKSKAADAA